jgi:hypothetical protein
MRLPRWLDRERLLREEKVIGRERAASAAMWFSRCLEARAEVATANAEITRLSALLAKYEGNPS